MRPYAQINNNMNFFDGRQGDSTKYMMRLPFPIARENLNNDRMRREYKNEKKKQKSIHVG